MISCSEHNERMRLYRAGMSDQEIAKALYVNRNSIYYWRKQNGLPSQNPRKRINREQESIMLEMYQSGASDEAISQIIQKSRMTVCAWRWRKKLPANKNKAGRRRKEDG